jgi:putative inorganic carbon (HCO3(-)) transporter
MCGFVVYLLLVLVVLGVPTVFTAWTVECGYVKNVLLASAVLLGVVLWTLRTIFAGRTKFTHSALNVAVIAYLVAAAASAFLSEYSLSSTKAFWRIAFFVGLYFLTANFATTRRRINGLLAAALLACLLVCGYALAQKMGYDFVKWSESARRRVFGSIGNPNMLAGYLVMTVPLLIALSMAVRSWFGHVPVAVAVGGALICLYMTQTKAAWLAFAVAMVVMASCVLWSGTFRCLRWTRTRKIALAVCVVLMLMGAGVLTPKVIHRFRRSFGASAKVRLVYWGGALGICREQPFTGSGIGTFQVHFPQHRAVHFRTVKVTYNTLHAHSEYLETLAEQGIVGAAALAFLLAAFAVVSLRAMRRATDPRDKWIACGLFAAAAGVLSQSLVSVILRWSVCPTFFWLVLGLSAAMANLSADGAHRRTHELRLRPLSGWVAAALVILLASSLAWSQIAQPFRAQLNLRRGDRLVRLAQWDAAEATLRRAIVQDRVEFRAYYKLGQVYHEQEDYQKALEVYRVLQQLAPDFAQIHYNVGVTYSLLGRWQEAADELLIASRTGTIPSEVNVEPLLAQARTMTGDEASSAEVLRELVKANPEDKLSLNRLGIWHFRRGELDQAAEYYERALEVDRRYLPALNNLAGVYYQRGELDESIRICRRILKIDPKSARTHVNLGRALYVKGDRDAGVAQWKKALEVDPDNAEAKDCLEKLGKPKAEG